MTDDRLPLAELMAKTGDGDFLRTIAESVLQIIMEADVDGLVGAGRHERSGDRTTWRNGYRGRSLDTRLGTLNLKIPKLRTGAYFPGFLEPRKTVEKALVAVIQRRGLLASAPGAWDELVQAMGMRASPVLGVQAVRTSMSASMPCSSARSRDGPPLARDKHPARGLIYVKQLKAGQFDHWKR
jgi:hypothetical protein